LDELVLLGGIKHAERQYDVQQCGNKNKPTWTAAVSAITLTSSTLIQLSIYVVINCKRIKKDKRNNTGILKQI